MGLRLYAANAAASYTPPTVRGGWSDAALTGASKLSLFKVGAVTTAAKAETSTSSSWSTLLRRFVSEPVNNAGVLDGVASIGLTSMESAAAANMNLRLYAYVTVGSTDVVRGVLTASAINGTSEWPPPSFGFNGWGQVVSLPALTAVNVQPGDRLIVELGYRAANSVATSYTGTLYYGGTGSDTVDWATDVNYRVTWIEFAGAGFIPVFSPPVRSAGTIVTTLNAGSVLTQGRKRMVADLVTETHLGSSLTVARKKFSTTTTMHVGSSTAGSQHIGIGEAITRPTIAFPGTAYHDSFGGEALTEVIPKFVTYTVLPGSIDPPDPDLELLTSPPRPTPRIPLRFIAQDIRTHRFLDWDLPLVDPEITYTLSGPKLIKAKLKPEYPSLAELDIDPWATWIHVEEDGQILASGILLPASVDDEEYSVTCLGASGYARGMPFFAEDQFIQADVCTVLRRIWWHLQSYPDAGLGVIVSPNTVSGTLLGIPERQARDENGVLQWTEEVIDLGSTEYSLPDGSTTTLPDEPPQSPGYYEDSEGTLYVVRYKTFTVGPDGEWEIDRKQLIKLTPVIEEAKPYVLAWYDDRDCGQEFDNLCKIAKVEYVEVDRWNATRTDIEHHIELAYPRVGRKRFDLRVALDENLLQAFILSESDDQYASSILVRGRGKGRAAVRGYAGESDPHRVRRVKIVADPTIRTSELANEYATDEILRARKVVTIGELVLDANHPNMPMGSFQPGDDVLVSARVPYGGDLELWHRIVSYTWKPDSDTVVAQVRRSEQFAYGRPVTGVTEGDTQ